MHLVVRISQVVRHRAQCVLCLCARASTLDDFSRSTARRQEGERVKTQSKKGSTPIAPDALFCDDQLSWPPKSKPPHV